MKQLVVDLSEGELRVIDVPEPTLRQGGVLVRTVFSVISTGTENTLLQFAKKNMIGKARERPDLFKAFLEKARRDGFLVAFQQAQRRLETYMPIGYSSAGIVTAVADDITDIKVGDKVACGGAEYAWHAEKVFVPRNLLARIPDGVDLKEAAFTTIAAIALNGIRCASAEIGHTIVIIGLGLLGIITAQIAKASGCVVIGIDTDARKAEYAEKLGIDLALSRAPENESAVMEFTSGRGADAVIITASTSSNDPVELAGKLCRDRGKVSIIGAVGLDIPREHYYKKELSIIIPRSYGPGRYDRNYEEMGHDYPIGYVRWTIARNMEVILNLIKERRISLTSLITDSVPLESAVSAYSKIATNSSLTIGTVLQYASDQSPFLPARELPNAPTEIPRPGIIKCGIVGAGTFATATALPLLSKTEGLVLHSIATANGLSARSAADKYSIPKTFSNYKDMLQDEETRLVLIFTRNSSHAKISIEAMNSGKNVFIEKPLALSYEELEDIENQWRRCTSAVLVGFNRRYAPFTQQLRSFFANRVNPMVATFRVNAEEIPSTHWIYDQNEGGGRIISEAPHFIDYLTYIIGSKPIRVHTMPISTGQKKDMLDNFCISLAFEDGSVGTVIYTSHGSKRFGKEYAEFFADNKSAVLDNFRTLKLVDNKKTIKRRNLLSQDKGHKWEFRLLANSIKEGDRMEEEFRMALTSTRATLAALRSLSTGEPQKVL